MDESFHALRQAFELTVLDFRAGHFHSNNAAVALFTSFIVLYWSAAYLLRFRVRHIPSPLSFPFVGHIPYLLTKPWEQFHRFAMQLGTVYQIWVWNKMFIVLADPEAVKYTFHDNRKNFPKDDWSYDYFRDILGYGLVTVEGSTWANHKQLLSPAFQFAALERLQRVFVGAADRFASQIDMTIDGTVPSDGPPESANAGPALQVMSGSRCNAELSGCFRNVTLEVISNVALGLGPEKAGVFPQLFEAILDELNQRPYKPWRQFMPWISIPYYRKLAALNDIVYSLIAARRALRKNAGSGAKATVGAADESAFADSSGQGAGLSLSGKAVFDGGSDMLDMILDSGVELTDKEVADELKTQLLAGHETTAMMLTWTCYLLAAHPECLAKAIEEVERELGLEPGCKDSKTPGAVAVANPTFEAFRGLRYVEQCMKEAMRLYSPVPILTRECSRSDVIPTTNPDKKFSIPGGTAIMISIWTLHKDAAVWGPDVDEFRPDRFGPDAPKRHAWSFIPFSSGPRVCIGQNLSLTEGKVVLGTLLRRFSLTLAPGQGKPVTDGFNMPVRPASGLHVILQRRDGVKAH